VWRCCHFQFLRGDNIREAALAAVAAIHPVEAIHRAGAMLPAAVMRQVRAIPLERVMRVLRADIAQERAVRQGREEVTPVAA